MADDDGKNPVVAVLENEMRHVRLELGALRVDIQNQTAAFIRQYKDHEDRIRMLEHQQIVLDHRWRIFIAASGVLGAAATAIGIFNALT